jgi:capsular polysaccharide biosynthesis protein
MSFLRTYELRNSLRNLPEPARSEFGRKMERVAGSPAPPEPKIPPSPSDPPSPEPPAPTAPPIVNFTPRK